jgi:hypothetical protein
MTDIEVKVCGVKCFARILHWEPYRPAKTGAPPEDCYPAEGGYGDWELVDGEGTRLRLVEEEMTAQDREQLEQQMFDYMEY